MQCPILRLHHFLNRVLSISTQLENDCYTPHYLAMRVSWNICGKDRGKLVMVGVKYELPEL